MSNNRYIIDVREPDEFASNHVAGAINIPLGQIEKISNHLTNANLADELILYCRSGGRAAMACQIVASMGYSNVTNGVNQATVEAKHL